MYPRSVVVKEYPTQPHLNNKFDLHETIIIEADPHIMTETKNGTSVSEPTSTMNDTTPTLESQGKEQKSRKTAGNPYTEYEKPITISDVRMLREITKAHNGERVSINDFTSEDIQAAQKWAYQYFKAMGTNSPFFRAWFGEWRAYEDNTDTDALVRLVVEEYGIDTKKRGYNVQRIKMSTLQTSQFSNLTRKSRKIGSSAMDGISIADLYSLVKTYDKDFHPGKAVSPALLNENGTPKIWYHQTGIRFTTFNNDNPVAGFGRGNILYKVGENGYSADVLVGVKDDGSAVLYDIINIIDKKIEEAVDTVENKMFSSGDNNSSANDSTTLTPESQEKAQKSRKTGRSATYHAYEIMDLFGIKHTTENRNSIVDTIEQMVTAMRNGGDYLTDDDIKNYAKRTAEYILPQVKQKRSARSQEVLYGLRKTNRIVQASFVLDLFRNGSIMELYTKGVLLWQKYSTSGKTASARFSVFPGHSQDIF